MENVPGLANGAGKPIFIEVLQRLNEIGYNTTHGIVDIADYGVPQKRKRLVMLGTSNSNIRLSFPSKTNQNPDLVDGSLKPWKSVRETIGNLPSIHAGEKSKNDPLHVAPSLAEINLKRMKNTPHDGGGRLSWPEELVLECHKKVNGYKDIYGRMKWDYPSPTITAGCVMISKGRFGHPEQDRAISLREAARLQTFPDNYMFSGNVGHIASQIGNAVPPLLAKRLAESLLQSIKSFEINEKVLTNCVELDDVVSVNLNFLQ